MGLSDEERLRNFYFRCYELRTTLGTLLPDNGGLRDVHGSSARNTIEKTVKDLIGSLDLIVGKMAEAFETNKLYWIMGESEELTIRNLFTEYLYDLGRQDDTWHMPPYGEEGHDQMFVYRTMQDSVVVNTEAFVAECDGKFYRGYRDEGPSLVVTLWRCWSQIPALLYNVNRYEDRLFGSCKTAITSFIGQFLHARLFILAQIENGSLEEAVQLEMAVMAKYRLYSERVEPIKRAYLDKVSERDEASGKFKLPGEKCYKLLEEFRDKEKQVLIAVCKMPITKVKTELEKLESAEHRKKSNTGRFKYPGVTSWVEGTMPRDQDLLEKIIDQTRKDPTTHTASVYNRAIAELKEAYGTHSYPNTYAELLETKAKKRVRRKKAK